MSLTEHQVGKLMGQFLLPKHHWANGMTWITLKKVMMYLKLINPRGIERREGEGGIERREREREERGRGERGKKRKREKERKENKIKIRK